MQEAYLDQGVTSYMHQNYTKLDKNVKINGTIDLRLPFRMILLIRPS